MSLASHSTVKDASFVVEADKEKSVKEVWGVSVIPVSTAPLHN